MPSSPENKGFGQGDPGLARWAEEVFRPEDAVLREIRERSVREGLPPIAVGRFDGLHLEVIARAIGALKAVEIGTLGGYSGDCLLRGQGGAENRAALRKFNDELARGGRFRATMLPTEEGLAMGVKIR